MFFLLLAINVFLLGNRFTVLLWVDTPTSESKMFPRHTAEIQPNGIMPKNLFEKRGLSQMRIGLILV